MMKINIQTEGFELNSFLRQHVERRVTDSLKACKETVNEVNVWLSDSKDPKGDELDKKCLLEVIFKGQSAVVAIDVEADLFKAITRAAGRAGRTVLRKIDRERQRMTPGSPKRIAIYS